MALIPPRPMAHTAVLVLLPLRTLYAVQQADAAQVLHEPAVVIGQP